MRHEYVGDVGDFGKYGLLRTIARVRAMSRLGILWYLTVEAENNGDGRHDGYLFRGSDRDRAKFRECDPQLYLKLLDIRQNTRLNLAEISKRKILAPDTIFFELPVPGKLKKSKTFLSKWEQRDQWFSEAKSFLDPVDLVFLDPDNGMIFLDLDEHCSTSPSQKHCYWHEAVQFLEKGRAVVVYHHLGRQRGGHVKHIQKLLSEIADRGFVASAIRYRRGSARAFLMISSSSDHSTWFAEATKLFEQTWNRHATIHRLG